MNRYSVGLMLSSEFTLKSGLGWVRLGWVELVGYTIPDDGLKVVWNYAIKILISQEGNDSPSLVVGQHVRDIERFTMDQIR